jgi:PQQ-like domain
MSLRLGRYVGPSFKRLLAVVSVTAAVTAAGVTSAGATTAVSPWLQSGYNGAGSHANVAEKTLSTANVTKLHPVRTLTGQDKTGCDGGADAVAFSDARVYVTANDTLTAYNAASGTTIWSTKIPVLDDNSFDTIAVSHGQVVIKGNECGTIDPEAYVEAFNSTTGKFSWGHTYGDGIYAMEVSGAYVVAHVFAGLESDPLTEVYRIGDGSTAWTTAGHTDTYCDAQPWVVHGYVFVSYCDGSSTSLRALHLATGSTAWTKPGDYQVLGGDTDAPNAQQLLIAPRAGGTVLELNPATGTTRLPFAGATAAGRIISPGPLPFIAIDATRAYLACRGSDPSVCAYNTITGKRAWLHPTNDASITTVAEANGVLYLGDGQILNASTGKVLTNVTGSVRLVGNGRVATIVNGDLVIFSV